MVGYEELYELHTAPVCCQVEHRLAVWRAAIEVHLGVQQHLEEGEGVASGGGDGVDGCEA